MKKAMRFFSVIMAFNMAFSSMNVTAYANPIYVTEELVEDLSEDSNISPDEETKDDEDELVDEDIDRTITEEETDETETIVSEEEIEENEETEIVALQEELLESSSSYLPPNVDENRLWYVGYCNSGLRYYYEQEVPYFYCLTFYGEGDMDDNISWGFSFPEFIGLTFYEGITSIGDYAFTGKGIQLSRSKPLPDSVTHIGEAAFSGCNRMFGTDQTSTFKISKNVNNIEDYAFSTSSISGFSVATDNSFYCSVDGVLFTKDMSTLVAYPAGKSSDVYVLPASVKNIRPGAFSGCKSLQAIEVEDGNSSFNSEDGVLYTKDMKTLLIYPEGKIDETFRIPSDVISIAEKAFWANDYIVSVYLPEGYKVFTKNIFGYCSNLTELFVPDSITWIECCPVESGCNLSKIYYFGTFEKWESLNSSFYSSTFSKATVYYVSLEPEVPAGCHTEGSTSYIYYTNMGKIVYVTPCEIIPATGEKIIDNAIDATCTETGLTEGSHCSICNTVIVEQEVVPAKGHKYEIWEKDDADTHTGTCSCGKTKKEEHIWDDGVITVLATHSKVGEKMYSCTKCDAFYIEELTITDEHVYFDWVMNDNETCTGTCECGEKKTEQHIWDEGKITKKATCTKFGVKEFSCKNCHTKKIESIEPVGHQYENGSCTECTEVTGVTLRRIAIVMGTGDETSVGVTITPDNATNKDVIWSSTDDRIATVNDGKIVAHAEGNVSIIVRTEDGNYTSECIVCVSDTPSEDGAIWNGNISEGFAKGSGSQADPYIVETCGQLAYFADSVNKGNSYEGKYIQLSTDLWLNTSILYSVANKWTKIGTSSYEFKGRFNGDGHTISGLDKALFGYVGKNGFVENLVIKDSKTSTACVADYNAGTIWKCRNYGNVDGTSCGGIVAYNRSGGTITRCSNAGTIKGSYAGGIVGENSGSISACYNTGIIRGGCGGGIAGNNGYVTDSIIVNCYNTGTISGISAGGIVGVNKSTINCCYNIGKVSARGYSAAGGIVSNVSDGTINGCIYLEGVVTDDIGRGTAVTDSELKSEYYLKNYTDFSLLTWEYGKTEGYDYPTLISFPHLGAPSHNYKNWVQISDDYHEGTCDCGDTITEKHIWIDCYINKDSSCVEEGTKTYTCAKCAKTKTETLTLKEHVWDAGTITTPATENSCGEILYNCQRCPETKSEIIAPVGGATGLYGTTRWVLYSNGCLEIEDTDKVYGTAIISYAKKYGTVTSIIINDCDEIVEDSFAYDQNITKVTIKGTVTKIGENAFANCNNLEELHIDGNVETISSNAFYQCFKLKSAYIPTIENWLNITFISEYSNPIAFSEGKLFVNNSEITEIVIPSGITSIKAYAFCGMSDISSITLPSGITSIGTDAFYRIRHGKELETAIYVPNNESIASAITGYSWTASNRKVTYLNYCCRISTNWITDQAVEPDCVTKGKTEGKHCKECNSVIVTQEEVAANGHTLVSIPAVESTCTSTGLTEGSYCAVCGNTIAEQEVTEKKSHSYKAETQKATTTADGYKIVKCQNCLDEKENIIYYHPTEIVFDMDSFEYDGTAKKPTVSVKDSNNGIISSDSYTIVYPENAVNVGTYAVSVDFKGNYSGELIKYYDIEPTSLSKATVVLEQDSYEYDGTAKCPSVTVTLNSKELILNIDYTVEYNDNINAGTATVKVVGTNNYKGEATKTFDISDEFDIEYNLNGGSNNASNRSTYKSSVGLILSNPEKTGYTFKGWYTEDTFKKQKSKINIGEYGDISLYAKWEADEYSASLDACGGTLNVEPVKIVYDKEIGELPTPKRAGCDFVGWFTEKEGGTEITKETISKYISNTTFYAHWNFIHYFVSFDANGGNIDAEPLSVTVEEEYGELPVASKSGYDFEGWFTEKEEGTKITSESKLPEAKDQTVYAHWSPKNITVSIDANGGECNESSINVTYASTYGELPVAIRTGYEFLGWFEEGKDVKISPTDIIEKTSEYTITAHWKANEYTLSFDSQGGTVCDDMTIVYDSAYGELPQTRKFSAYFDGWYTLSDGGTKVNAEDIVNVTENQTLYAHWTLKYSVSNPKFSIATGTELKKGSKVTITSETNGVKIYYSLDGSAPVVADENQYADALIINSPVTIKAIAVKEGYADSEIVSATYTIKDESADWGDVVTEDRALYANANEIPESFWIAGVSNQNYTGKAITFPEMRVYYHKQLLKNGTDYTVKYASNIKAGNATVTITGKGNYSGTIVKTFKINPLSLGDGETNNENLKVLDIMLAYTGKVQKGTTVVTYMINGESVTLKSGTDFIYQYSTEYDYESVGDHYIIIKGKGNYSGTAKIKETIDSSKKMIAKVKLNKMANMNADGTALTPDVILFDGAYRLVKDTDYTLEWQNNVLPGTATVIISGINDYAGTRTTTFKINAIAISKAVVSGIVAQPYTGNKTSQSGYILTYKAGKNTTAETLVEGTDYTVSYSSEINAGNKATIIFTGINRFSGTLKKTYTITPYVLSDGDVTPANIGTVSYQKNGATPVITVTVNGKTLKNGTDYTLKYSNNKSKNDGTNLKSIPTVTITGKGNYKGTITRTFKIEGSSLEVTRMTATDIVYAQKTGICKPTITLYDTNNTKLAAGTDYDKTNIKYEYAKDVVVIHIDSKKNITTEEKVEGTSVDMKKDIIPVGTEIKVTVYGKGNYAGTEKSTIFRFVKADISKATIKVNAQGYTGYELTPSKDELTITIGSGKNAIKLAKTDYEIVGYSANINKGKALITIHGLGNYGGTKTINFTIDSKSMNYTIVFDKNSSSAIGKMKNASITEGKALMANAYKWSGHTFKGWSYTPDGEVVFINKDKFVDSTGRYGRTITLYAIWN